MRYFFLTFLTCLVILFTACSKKATNTATRENMLRTGKWKLASGTITVKKPNAKDTILDYLKMIPDCYKDDYLVFDSLKYGRRYTGSNTCSPADPQYFTFVWQLHATNSNMIDLYNGFNYIYGVVDTVQPWRADTLSQSPYLVLDTVMGYYDTIAPPKTVIAIDTVRPLFFSGIPGGIGATGETIGGFDIYDAVITNFSQGSFTLNFQMHSYYPDSTKWHGASFLIPLDDVLNPDSFAVYKADTFNYSLTFTNF